MSIVGLLALLPMKADEGMWTLYNLPQAVYDQMKAYGYSLPYESLYSGNNPIKGSVVLFGGFCSGVVVSPDGLVFTNHHCGFEAIRSHSTVEHDYMLNGFYAKTAKDELPNENLFVSFMIEQQDVTARLQALDIDDMPFDKQADVIDSIAAVMTDSVKKIDKSYHVEIDPYYEGNQYYATTYQLFPDVRLVFAVPKSMGSSAARPTTGCGRARRATSACSAYTPTRRLTARQNTRRPTCRTNRNHGHPCQCRDTRTATSQ